MPKGIPRARQATLKRLSDFRSVMQEKIKEEELLSAFPDERTFAVIREGISELLRIMDKPEYLVITNLQHKGVSQARSFLISAQSILEQVDKKVYY